MTLLDTSSAGLSAWARSELREMEELGLSKPLLSLTVTGPNRMKVGEREVVCFCSNDYLGLGYRLRSVNKGQVQRSAGASRSVCGNTHILEKVEEGMARLCGYPTALFFSSGYLANISALPALASAQDLILIDAYNHASTLDGSRLSEATYQMFPHRDVGVLRDMLKESRQKFRHVWIVSDGVFSMEGTFAQLQELKNVALEYDAFLYLDDSHGIGTLGDRGVGLSELMQTQADVLVGTFGKSFGASGAFVLASAEVRELLTRRARGFVYSSGLSTSLAVDLRLAVSEVEQAASLRAQLQTNVQLLRRHCRDMQQEASGDSRSPLLILEFEGMNRAAAIAQCLLEKGFLVRPVRSHWMPRQISKLRIIPTALHEPKEIESFALALQHAVLS